MPLTGVSAGKLLRLDHPLVQRPIMTRGFNDVRSGRISVRDLQPSLSHTLGLGDWFGNVGTPSVVSIEWI